MSHHQPLDDPFAEAVAVADEAIDLARAALLIARDEYPELDIWVYLSRLDGMADQVAPHLQDSTPTDEVIQTLNAYLFEELGFRGNREDYYDPRNSFLNDVLDRRLGIPITLSLVYIELGRRLGLPIRGVALPGHFIVRYEGATSAPFIDPFNQGARLTPLECQQRLVEIYGTPVALRAEWLEPVGNRHILTRMLYNLKGIYVRQGDAQRAIPVVRKLLLLNPQAHEELRDLGSLHGMLGRYSTALMYFQRYLDARPDAPDAEAVRNHMEHMIAQIARWN